MRKTPGVWGQAPKGGDDRSRASILPRACCQSEKAQLIHRLPPEFIRQVLGQFNSGSLDWATAAAHLDVCHTRLYELRTEFLRDRDNFAAKASGGGRHLPWPAKAVTFLERFLPLQSPPNYQLVADELERLCGFKRARSNVEAYVKEHLPHLVPARPRKNRPYRRFRRAHIGELWQHDSSIHQWWPAPTKQILLLTVDDHSGLNLGGRFVTADTTWNHFCHFRALFEDHGVPEAIYTDALSLFGASSSNDHSDPKSEFQRALRALGVAHLVAPTPQAKGKIERRFGTFQRRLVTLLAYAGAISWEQADEVLQMEIARLNRTLNRATALVPQVVWDQALLARTGHLRPTPVSSLLDLHLSMRQTRRVNNDQTIDFEGRNYEIGSTLKKSVTIIHHPERKFWVVGHPPKAVWPPILGTFGL
jgi:hypothetical protein